MNESFPAPERNHKNPIRHLTTYTFLTMVRLLNAAPTEEAASNAVASFEEQAPKEYEKGLKEFPAFALVQTALLERNYAPSPSRLWADPSLVIAYRMDMHQVLPLVYTKVTSLDAMPQMFHETIEQPDDPSSFEAAFDSVDTRMNESLARVRDETLSHAIVTYGYSPVEIGHAAAMVSRNISWLQGEPYIPNGQPPAVHVQPRDIDAEVSAIVHQRESLANTNIFEHTDVMVVANDERNPFTPDSRFGTKSLQYVIESRMTNGTVFSLVRPHDDSPQEAQRVLGLMRASVENGERPLTLVIDAHGNPNEIALTTDHEKTQQHVAGGIYFDTSTLAKALQQRWESQRAHDLEVQRSNIRLIVSTCNSQDFVRTLSQLLSALHVPLPQITITESEYGQFGFSDFYDPLGSSLWRWMYNNPSIGSMIQHTDQTPDQTPSIFTPRPEDQNKLMQIGGLFEPYTTFRYNTAQASVVT